MPAHQPIPATETHRSDRVTQCDFVLLSKHGAFLEFAKAELIEGVIVTVNAQYSRQPHADAAPARFGRCVRSTR